MKLSAVSIATPRLRLRPYSLEDAPALFQLISEEKEALLDYFPLTVESNTSLMASRSFIRTRAAEIRDGRSYFCGIFENESGALIGQVTVKDINWRVPKCEVGYFIKNSFRGKGYAPEAVKAMCEFCFEKAGMVKVMLRIEDINVSSKKVAEKCGFTYSGLLRNDFRSVDGRLMDCEVWERIG